MKLISRRQPTAEEIAAAALAEDQRRRLADQFARDQAAADREEQRRAARERARAEKRRRKAQAKARARRRARVRALLGTARTVGPLLLVNAAAVGGQLAYAYDQTPAEWHPVARVAVAVGVAAAAESVALYVGWHAHDALLAGARTTAARLRRASYAIALVMAAVNYSHFAESLLEPTALAVILGVLSSLSPWLWGLHTRRQQHVQLLREDLVDETGAAFDPARRRAFPIRSLLARRWSIDHHVRDPRAAWEGYRQHRATQRAAAPTGRIRAAWAALRGRPTAPTQATQPEPTGLDPDLMRCAEVRVQMAQARERITSGAARAMLADRDLPRWADVSPGGLWDMVDATDEPAHLRRPARPRVDAVLTVGRADPAPDPGPDPAGPVEQDAEGDRLAAAYKRLTRELGREPSGRVLGRAAGVGKSTANRWKQRRRVP
ncbi:hypothetical protein [Micromonospora sp. NPDC047730]|uniref:hypothetical protein n=1 Tax=Micromonospora sp. NPDC047730 TaxID=3364253 RepID=UPI003717AE10